MLSQDFARREAGVVNEVGTVEGLDLLWNKGKDALRTGSHPVKLPVFCSWKGETNQNAANMPQVGGQVYQCHPHSADFRSMKDTRVKGSWIFLPWFKSTSEAKRLTGKYHHGDPERSLHEAMEVKLVLHWRPQDVRSTRTVGYLPKRAVSKG